MLWYFNTGTLSGLFFLSSFYWSLDAMCDWEEWFQSLIIKWIQIFSYTGFSVSLLTVQHAARGRLAFKQKTFSNPFWESVRPSRCVLSGLRELHITLTKYFQNKTASSRLNSFFWETVNQITINNVPTQSSIHAKAKQNKFTFKKRNWYYPFDYFFCHIWKWAGTKYQLFVTCSHKQFIYSLNGSAIPATRERYHLAQAI